MKQSHIYTHGLFVPPSVIIKAVLLQMMNLNKFSLIYIYMQLRWKKMLVKSNNYVDLFPESLKKIFSIYSKPSR